MKTIEMQPLKTDFHFSWEVGDWTSCDLHCSGVRTRPVQCSITIREKRILVRLFLVYFSLSLNAYWKAILDS